MNPGPDNGPSRVWKIFAAASGVAALAVGWYLTTCLGEQRTALRETKELWGSVRKTGQKYVDDRAALSEHMKLFYLSEIQENPSAKWIEGRRQELVSMLDGVESDCNAAKGARYDFDQKLGNLCVSFSVQRPELSNVAFVEQMCGGASQAAARLRSANAENLAKTPHSIRVALLSRALKLEEMEDQVLAATQDAEREHDRRVQRFFGQIETRSIWMNVWGCAEASLGGH